MSDSYSIQEVGGAELAQHYPDRGVIPDSDYHKAVLTAGQQASGWRKLFAKSERFIAALSAHQDGLRVFVSRDNFKVLVPWSELTASGERATPGTVVRLKTTAVPSMNLELHLDDEAADTIFAGVIAPLPRRSPPGRLYWPKPWAFAALIGFMLVAAITLAVLKLHWLVLFAVVCVLSVVMSLVWHVCRSVFEEDRPQTPRTTDRRLEKHS
jgi:hypothetical protein